MACKFSVGVGAFWRAQCFLSRPCTSLMAQEASQQSFRLRSIQLSHRPQPHPQPQLCPRREAACPRITDLLIHICSGDFTLHILWFLELLGSLANTEPSYIQCQVLGCGLCRECDRNRNQMQLLALRVFSAVKETDVSTNKAKAGWRELSCPTPDAWGNDVKPAFETQLSSWGNISAAAFVAAGIGSVPTCRAWHGQNRPLQAYVAPFLKRPTLWD